MPRHARLREPEDAGQLGDVQPLARQHPQQPQPRLVAEQPVERRRLLHIYKSTFIDVNLQDLAVDGPGPVLPESGRDSSFASSRGRGFAVFTPNR